MKNVLPVGAAPPQACAACKGAGVIQITSEYPDLEDNRFCARCEKGRSLAARIARIVASTRADEQGDGPT